MKKTTKAFSLLLSLVLSMTVLALPARAENVEYYYYVTQAAGSTAMHHDLYENVNLKTLADDPATIKCTGTDAPGYGFYLRLISKSADNYTRSYWYNSSNYLRHPVYEDQASANKKYYLIEGRFDNDYTGTYYITGLFNADYTSP